MALSYRYIEQFLTRAKKQQENSSIPSFGISIVSPSGNVTLASGSNTNEATLFPVGSMSKAFAATLIGILIDKGLIDWSDSIKKFIDVKLPNDIDLTVAQLLRHINPFPEHALTEVSEFGFSRQQLVNKLQYIKVNDTAKFSYQNVLFSLVADIIEKVTGKSYEHCLKQEILVPLKMLSTTVEEKAYLNYANKALPHIKYANKIQQVPYSSYWHVMGAPSCLSSTVTDLTQWMKFNLQIENDSLISKHSLNVIQSPIKESYPPYAMGWWKADEKGLVLCHTGSVTGFESAVAIIPTYKVGITVCSNVSGDNFTRDLVSDFIKNIINENTFNCTNVLKLQMPLTKPKLELAKFVGIFYHPVLEKIKISCHDDVLLLEIGRNQVVAKLCPISLLKSHIKMTPNLEKLAPHHCFQVSWQHSMEAAGKVYYDDDKVAFAENHKGEIDTLLLFAEAISGSILSCKRASELFLDEKACALNKKQITNKKWWLGVGIFAIGVAGLLTYGTKISRKCVS